MKRDGYTLLVQVRLDGAWHTTDRTKDTAFAFGRARDFRGHMGLSSRVRIERPRQ